jgi:hypothetical protein
MEIGQQLTDGFESMPDGQTGLVLFPISTENQSSKTIPKNKEIRNFPESFFRPMNPERQDLLFFPHFYRKSTEEKNLQSLTKPNPQQPTKTIPNY